MMTASEDFYNTLAADYDSMTRSSQRLAGEEQMLRSWRARYGFDSALDAACGTGLHSVVLARMGVRTTGSDPSPAMLDTARRLAVEQGVKVRFLKADFASLETCLLDRFDAVLVLGNSLPHVLSQEDLDASIHGLTGVLAGQGILVLQLLNYERILDGRERIVGVNRDQDRYFVRFYDFLEDVIQFNVLILHSEGSKVTHRLTSTVLKPYRLAELATALEAAGLRVIDTFGDMNFSPFDAGSSTNLVIVARRN